MFRRVSMFVVVVASLLGVSRGAKEHQGMEKTDVVLVAEKHSVCEQRVSAKRLGTSDPTELIMGIADSYGVPAGALYGIWMKETRGLRRGWGSQSYWYRASRLTWKRSVCAEQYGTKRCRNEWRALKRICAQRRYGAIDGSRLCNRYRVRTSYAMALGPMQHMPTSLLLKKKDGTYRWAEHAIDYDQDGVIDPFSLPDAMAMTAKFLRHHFQRKVNVLGPRQAWRYAINRYYGSQKAGYYEGDGRRLGVLHYWRTWCKETGNCETKVRSSPAFAMRPPIP